MCSTQGDLPNALQSYRDGLAIAEQLEKADPGNTLWQRDLDRASRHFRAEVVGKTRKAGWWRPNRSHVISYLGLVRCDRMC